MRVCSAVLLDVDYRLSFFNCSLNAGILFRARPEKEKDLKGDFCIIEIPES